MSRLDRVREFSAQVKTAPTNKQSERVVRAMLCGVANNCPMDLLVHIGQLVVDYRKDELRRQAERN